MRFSDFCFSRVRCVLRLMVSFIFLLPMISSFLFLVSTEVDQGCCNLAWLELIKTSLSSIKRRQVRIWWSHFIPASSLFLWIFMFSTRDQEVWGPLGNQSIFPPICLCLSSPNLICSAHFLRAIFWITSSIMLFLAVYKKKIKPVQSA